MGKYLEACNRCRTVGTMCFGHPGITCEPCSLSKKKCDKSGGRGRGAAAKDAEDVKPIKAIRKCFVFHASD